MDSDLNKSWDSELNTKRCLYICHYFYIIPTLFACFLTCQCYFMYILYMAKVQWQCSCAGLIICYQMFIAMLYVNHGKVNRIYYCKHLMTEVKGSMIRDMHHLTMFHILVRWCITMGWAWASSKLLIYYTHSRICHCRLFKPKLITHICS